MDFVNFPQILKLFGNVKFICQRLNKQSFKKEFRFSFNMLTFAKK